jgi:thioredoxin 2
MPSSASAPSLDDRGVLIACPSCGRTARLAYAALGKHARCGQCKTDLPSPAGPIEAGNSEAFDAAASQSALPVIVDFWAPWCGPCRMVAPELEKLARTHAGEWLVVKVNTDALTDVAERFRIQSIPTLAVVRGGRELGRTVGVRPAADIERFVSQIL